MLSSLRLLSILYVVQSAVLQKEENAYSFAVNVHVLTPNGLMGNCIGSLISPTFVITAAHCGSEGQAGYVTVPTKNITSDIDKIHRFEKINNQSPMKKDLAIVKLRTPINSVTPVKLLSFFDDLNAAVAFLSYHKDTIKTHTMRMQLKHPDECDRYGIYTPLYFCAGEKEMSTEAGDSGAPVIVESSIPTQIGVIIGQQQLDQNNLLNGNLNPTVILKIPLFCDWIRNVTKGVRCI